MRIVASLTSIPGRTEELLPVLQVLSQHNLDKIYVWIPEVLIRTGAKGAIPSFADHQFRVPVEFQLIPEYGSLTKLVPTLLAEQDPDTQILVCDDDSLYYNHHWLDELQKKSSSSVVPCYSGFSFAIKENNLSVELNVADGSTPSVIEAYCGYLVHRGMFEDDFFLIIGDLIADFENNLDTLISDDFVISLYLRAKGNRLKVVYNNICNRYNCRIETNVGKLLAINENGSIYKRYFDSQPMLRQLFEKYIC